MTLARQFFAVSGSATVVPALRRVHRISAMFIAAFALVHIANHLVSLWSIAAHIAFMDAVRTVIRQRIVEATLLACVSLQAITGLWLFKHRWRQRRGKVAWLQALSGAYLAFFLLVHVAAILFGRAALKLDTNFYYAAAGFHVAPYQFFFAPYYFLAVFALFAHVGCAVYRRARPGIARTLALALPISAGAITALLIVLSLAGMLQPVDIPAKYKATYAG
jgi:succinate dehydrogenase/fumarate reductase cytochrome b subunit